MIINEIKDRIEAKWDIQELKNNSRKKEIQEYHNQKGERSAPRKAYVSTNTCTIESNVQYLDVQIQGRQKAT